MPVCFINILPYVSEKVKSLNQWVLSVEYITGQIHFKISVSVYTEWFCSVENVNGNTHVHTWHHMDEAWISRQPGLTNESDHKVLVSLCHTDSSCNMYIYHLVTKLYILIIYQGEHPDSVILSYLLCIHFWQDCHWSSFPPLTDSLCCAVGQAVRDRKIVDTYMYLVNN